MMKDDEDSLTSLLPTPALRTELALLIALCSDEMRRNVLTNFPEPKQENVRSSVQSTTGNLIDLISDEREGISEAEHKRIERDRDLASPRMQNFRRASLSFFDTWRSGVLRRVAEVLGVKPQDIRLKRVERNAKVQAESEKRSIRNANHLRDHGSPAQIEGFGVSIPTSLSRMEEAKRSKILLCLLLLILSLEHYTAHSRIMLQIVTVSLHLPLSTLSEHESTVSHLLLSTAANMSAEESTKKEADENAVGRRWKVGLATVAGAALIGVTGGLAAPFLAAGIGTVMGGLGLSIPLIGGYLGAMAGSSILIGGLFGSYGGRMTGRIMQKYAKEVEDFSFIPIRQSSQTHPEPASDNTLSEAEQSTHKLRIAIGISGWLTQESDITTPWTPFSPSTIEPFALRYEVSALSALGISISKFLKSAAWSAAKLELVRRTIFASLLAGLWPLGLLRVARVLDNPYSVAKARSDKAGWVLAQALMQKVQGERPVVLVGYSLGARVIYQALLALAERNAFGLVESVVFIGAPVPVEERSWRLIRGVVAGRVVNVYSQEDYMLGFLYRTSSLAYGVAGLQAIEDIDNVENYDATTLIDGKGHAQYKLIVGQILRQIGFEDIDLAEVEREEQETWKAANQQGVDDLIPTDDLLTATELPEDWEKQLQEPTNDTKLISQKTREVPIGLSSTTTLPTRPANPDRGFTQDRGSISQKTNNKLSTINLMETKTTPVQPAAPSQQSTNDNGAKQHSFDKRLTANSSTQLIEIDETPGQSAPTEHADGDESDEDDRHKIKMVDLDPEPILE